MYTLSQIETNSNQILNFKSLSDTERYWDIFIYKMNLIKLKYLKPILIPSRGYSYSQLQEWDFFNCVIPIPIFSEKFTARMKDVIIDEMEFVPCELISTKGNIIANMGLIKNNLPLLNEEKSGKRFLSNGDTVLDLPLVYDSQPNDFYIARDQKHPNLYVVSERFKELCDDEFNLIFHPA